MVDIREYLRKKGKNEKKDSNNFKREIRAHRLKVILRSCCVIGVIAARTVTAVTLLKNQTYSGYTVVSAIDRNQVSGPTLPGLHPAGSVLEKKCCQSTVIRPTDLIRALPSSEVR